MMNPREILRTAGSVLVIDWPSRDVPESLALAGLRVVVRGGPGAEDFSAYEVNEGAVVSRRIGRPPERIDLIYSHRPLSELAGIVATAKEVHAKAIWTQSGLSAADAKDPRGCWDDAEDLAAARRLVESAGIQYVSQPYIGDVAREIQSPR